VDEQSMRQCPTPVGDHHQLIAHWIPPSLCLARQRDYYHKCHRCQYRGKPAQFRLDEEGTWALPPDPAPAEPPAAALR
jgi:hypothetical protein